MLNPGKNSVLLRLAGLALGIFAVIATLGGAWATLRFDGTPGPSGPVPETMPLESHSQGGKSGFSERAELLLFAHPMCPCTKATLHELAQVLNGMTPPPHVKVFFERYDPAWQPDGFWQAASRLPGVEVQWDENGAAAKRFGARTSGLVLLYGRDGQLLFQGGVTGLRGHTGENRGADQLIAALHSGKKAGRRFPVFGCALGAFSNTAAAAADSAITGRVLRLDSK